MEFQQYFYFWGNLLLIPLWIYLFLKKDKRSDMLFVGIGFGIGAILVDSMYATLDYWSPVYLIKNIPFEDFLYGFFYGGISSELYEIILNKRNSVRRIYHPFRKLLLITGILVAFSFWFFVNFLRLNSIIAHIIPPIAIGIISAIIHKETFRTAFVNGLLIVILTFMYGQIMLLIYPNMFINHWYLNRLSGLFIFSIPIEELIFAFAFGFGAANAFEVIYGYKVINTIKTKTRK